MALTTGLAATAFGYMLQGFFKFGGVEVVKIKCAQSTTPEKAWQYRIPIYLLSAGVAETIADIFLCPLEAVRIRSVSQPDFCSSMVDGLVKLKSEMGIIKGYYSGFGPMLFKQVPYTMAKFAVQGLAAENIYKTIGAEPSTSSNSVNTVVSLSSVIAGVVAAIISHPADTLLSKVK